MPTYSPPNTTYTSALRGANLIPGGAGLEAASAQDISNELAGVLPDSFIQSLQTGMAERGAAGGFGVDSANTNAAALRAMGIQSQQLQTQGQTDLMAQLGLAENQSSAQAQETQAAQNEADVRAQNQAQNTLEAQAQANAVKEWQAQLAEQTSEYGQSLQQTKDALAAQMGLSYSQLDEQQKEFVNSQAQQLSEQQSTLSENARQANQANALSIAQMQAQMQQANDQYQLELTGQKNQYTLAEQAAQQANQQFMYSTPPWAYGSAGGSTATGTA